jgi:peptidoglycan/LPS O-acetylase OafA/YrhL
MTARSIHAYRPDIDGLRALSVLAVVAFHTGVPGVRGGFVGVDVFFVISGFLITGLLLSEVEQRGRISFAHFYARRIRRILPTLVLVTAATLGAAVLLLSPALGEVQGVAQSAVAAMLMVSNVFFLNKFADYFAGPAAFEPLLHTWSLAVEEQYYLVWPILINFAWLPAGGDKRRRIGFVLAGVLLASLIAAAWMASWRNSWAFYMAPARAWELALGGLIAVRRPGRSEKAAGRFAPGALAASIGLAMILGSALLITPGRLFPIPLALFPVVGAALVIYGNALAPDGAAARILSNRALVQIGRASYAWYLWHWPVLSITRILTLGAPNLPRDVGLSGLTLVLALATVRWFEDPVRGYGRTSIPDWRVVKAGSLAIATVVLLALGAGYWAKHAPMRPKDSELRRAALDTPPIPPTCWHQQRRTSQFDRVCLTAPAKARIAVWGDSFAEHWLGAIDQWAAHQSPAVGVDHLIVWACPPLVGAHPDWDGPSNVYQNDDCAKFNTFAAKEITSAQGMAGVVLASDWIARDGGDPSVRSVATLAKKHLFDVSAKDETSSLASMEIHLRETLRRLALNRVRVLLVLQSPALVSQNGQRLIAPVCLFRENNDSCSISVADSVNRARAVDLVLTRVASNFPNVRTLDPVPLLCGRARCYARVNGVVAYTDEMHISATMSRALSARIAPDLDWLIGSD